ncbi:sensor histidine kinase [Bacillus sp. Bva_UNVM-123]|uniref:sensor histidine kinase n=1 Tax=Bacillus sp. Bva_UNVM-123 TaxID=2829798 RepID=UPI00391F25A4
MNMAVMGRKIEIFPSKYGFFPYIFLVYLFMPGYYLSFLSGFKAFIGYMLLGLFLISYRQLYFFTASFPYWLILQMAIIFTLAVFFNINNLFLGFFSANFIGWVTNKKRFYLGLGLFAIMLLIPIIIKFEKILSGDFIYFLPFILIMFISPFGIRSMNSKMELERKLDEANETIRELSKREERMRIARDLHDTLGHTLSLITLKSQLVGKLITKDIERAKDEVKAIERTSRSALSQVRELVSDMRTITIAEELMEAEAILKAAGISYVFEGETTLTDIPLLTQNILSMCLREAVTNVVKHSHAKTCLIQVEEKAGEIRLCIHDNGRGMSTNNHTGNGLKGISERLELIDGSVEASTDGGTKLVITVPIIVKEREADVVS